MLKIATRRVEPQWHHQALIHRPNALVTTLLRAHLRVSPGGTRCVLQLTWARTSVSRPVPLTKETTGGSTMVPMTVPMTTSMMTHGTVSHADMSCLTTKAHFEDNASILYGYQPSSPYRSSLYVPPRLHRISFKDAFENVKAFQESLPTRVLQSKLFSFLKELKN
jgi:hypothetical protein